MTTACSALPGGGKGPAGEATSKEDTLARARQQGYFTVGFANEKPFAYKTPDGKVTGEAVETARAAFAAMGIKDTKSGVPLDRMVIVPDQPAALAALKTGRANSITMTGPALQALLADEQITGTERVQHFVQPEIDRKSVAGYGATAFRKGDDAFRQLFNQELAKLQQSGQLLKTIEPVGFTASELPGGATSEQICKRPGADVHV